MEDRKREILIAIIRILLCVVYVAFLFSKEIRGLQKQKDKIRAARAREQIRLDRQRYRIRRAAYGRQRKTALKSRR